MTTPTNSDIAAIEAALAAGPTEGPRHVEPQEDGRWEICTSPGAWILDVRSTSEATEAERAEDLANVELMATCSPARLRRVLDTMRAMGEAMAGVAKHIEGRLPMRGNLRDNDSSRAALHELRAALAAYEGKQ